MMRFITKKEYWDIENSGILSDIGTPPYWHLKNIQDAVAYSFLHGLKDKHIAEIGGGNSRILPALAKDNFCYNIEPYEGTGGGPKVNELPSVITSISAYLGENNPLLNSESFDATFSVSVIEHVETPKLESLFKENARILRPDGLCLHLIDIYCSEMPNESNMLRYKFIKKYFFDLFEPLSNEIIDEQDLFFLCSHATNPDNAMNLWNKAVPSLRETRETCQSCTILLAGKNKSLPLHDVPDAETILKGFL